MKCVRQAIYLTVFLPCLFWPATEALSRPDGKLDRWRTSPLRPYDIVALSDNSVWLTVLDSAEEAGERRYIGKVFTIDPSDGSTRECVANREDDAEPIAEEDRARFQTLDLGTDDTLWIADTFNRIWHFFPSECDDPADAFEPYPLQVVDVVNGDTLPDWQFPSSCSPYGVSAASDGIVWFTCLEARHIGRLDPRAERLEDRWRRFDLPEDLEYISGDDGEALSPGSPVEIAFGGDGMVWFTIRTSGGGHAGLGRIDPHSEDGNTRVWLNPAHFPANCFEALHGRPHTPHGISVNDGMGWFVDHHNNNLLSFDPSEPDEPDFRCLSIPPEADDGPWDSHYFVQDREGIFWITAFGRHLIGTLDSDTRHFDTLELSPGAQPMGITMSPTGAIWWAETFSTGQGGVGRFLPLSIREPAEALPAWAGTSSDGNRVLVRLVGAGELDLSLDNLRLEVGGEPLDPDEQIALHSQIESETWLVIMPGAREVGCYDLTVSLVEPDDVSVTQPHSLCYRDDEERTVDRVIAIDRTRSMLRDRVADVYSEEKMNAARAAGQFFVDLTNDHDGIGVVSFQRTDENGNGRIDVDEFSKIEIGFTTAIVDDDHRRDLLDLVWNITPGPGGGSETSLGAGLDEAKRMLDGSPRTDSDKSIALITDGRENLPPFWSEESLDWFEGSGRTLRDEFDPARIPEDARITIDAVSIGLDAENAVLRDMTELTGGTLRNELEGTGSFGLMSRLASTFKAIDEDNRGEQRFFYQEGCPEKLGRFIVEEHLDWMTVAFHWDLDGAVADLTLIDPDGNAVETTRKTQKHAVYHVPSPPSGGWRYRVPVCNPNAEFFAVASGPTLLTARLRIGDTAPDADGSWTTPLRVWIADEIAVLGAEVVATIRRPDKSKVTKDLLDEGISADGTAGDGVYGVLVDDTLSGPYSVHVVARGIAHTGETFERFMSAAFVVPGEPDASGQDSEDTPGQDDEETKFCGGLAWCCWLWIAFLVSLTAATLMLMRLLCHIRRNNLNREDL